MQIDMRLFDKNQFSRSIARKLTLLPVLGCLSVCAGNLIAEERAEGKMTVPAQVRSFVEQNCLDCHDSSTQEGGLDLTKLDFNLQQQGAFDRWVLIHDRVRDGEMPPDDPITGQTLRKFTNALAPILTEAEHLKRQQAGRSEIRRLNRYEYENTLRELLGAPWLMVAEELPSDGTAHHFSKSSVCLDVSHVQMEKYLDVGREALRKAVDAAAYPSEVNKYYARREKGMSYIKAGIRRNTLLLGWEADVDAIAGKAPKTAWGKKDIQEKEAVGVFYGPHPAFTRYDFLAMNPPVDGRYKLRMKSYSIAAGKNGLGGSGVDPERRGQEKERWYMPNVLDIQKSKRSEPISLYALRESGDTRWLGSFDAQPEPHLVEIEVTLKAGDSIRPDAARLPRLRPGWSGNPLAVDSDHIPGWAIQWLEVEGPITEQWPPTSYRSVFGEMPFEVKDNQVHVISKHPEADARRLLSDLARRAFRGRTVSDETIDHYMEIYREARRFDYDFTDATITAASAILASPEFLYLQMEPGKLDSTSLASRLAYFLWNGPPDQALLSDADLNAENCLRRQTDRLLDDARSEVFVEHFLDFWLDLRDIGNTIPDTELYPDYYLDGHLTESSVAETRAFFQELVSQNKPARNLVDADFSFVNERLARHYDLKYDRDSLELAKVDLPLDSPRGGLLTQASVMKVTANGTTTSPVLRGVWIVERMLGLEIPDPPSGVEAIEPDTRGATTIREQLAKHTETASCAACHKKFDPIGFALESFDVMGGWREKYRALGEIGEPVDGYGMNGHSFEFRLAKPVEDDGQMADGTSFDDIHQLKSILLKDERAIARNLVNQLIVYATSEPVSFADRDDVEQILDDARESGYGVRDLIHGVVQSELFRSK